MAVPEPSQTRAPDPRPVVLDTHIALDLLLFEDPSVVQLRSALAAGRLRWIATAAMVDEFARVLGYPALRRHVLARARAPAELVAAYRRGHQPVPAAVRAPVTCTDPDDQVFLDLAVAHRALLLSRDRAVLRLRSRLHALGATMQDRYRTDDGAAVGTG